MSEHSKIEWTDATWNPVRGCAKISPGCKHCYAEAFAERFRGVPGHPYEWGFELRLVPDKLSEPLRWSSPKTVFVNSMSDLFQKDIPVDYIADVARVMLQAPWHTFQVLTKRSERLMDLLQGPLSFAARAPHIWWGVSVEDKRYGVPRIDHLRSAPASVRFLSIEPLLEDVGSIDLTAIHWVIVGGESGRGARKMAKAWVESIRKQCDAQSVPFFFKQWGGFQKSKNGRELNSRTYDDMPSRALAPMPERARRMELIAGVEEFAAAGDALPWSDSQIVLLRDGIPLESTLIWEEMSKNNKPDQNKNRQGVLFDLGPPAPRIPEIRPIQRPIWTENKAKLIAEYLYRFVQLTFHGTYIDAFAGPQAAGEPETWAAKLVLEREPRWLRPFYLFEQDKKQIEMLERLKTSQPPPNRAKREQSRTIEIYGGDCNEGIKRLLTSKTLKQEATFCLLDQRTFECHWSTLEALARYKTSTKWKIELFYFLATGWLDRSIAATKKDQKKLKAWWGGDDWQKLRDMNGHQAQALFVAERFRTEFGYRYVSPWPIQERSGSGRVMYYMIHATDHDDATDLMRRAYDTAVTPLELSEQLALKL